MDATQLKRDLETYAGYKGVTDPDSKIIENSILKSVIAFLRPVSKDVYGTPIFARNASDELRKEVVLKDLDGMKKVSKEYFINQLVVCFMSRAHNDWILENKCELVKDNIKHAEKFVPLELLTIKEFNEYLGILKPIFDSLKIDFDNKEIRNVFSRSQLEFMLRNELYTDENLAEKIMNVKIFNPQILEVTGMDEESIQEIYAREDVAKDIAERVKGRVHINLADKFKEVLRADNGNIGFLLVRDPKRTKGVYRFSDNISQKKIGFKKQAYPRPDKPVSKSMFQLARNEGFVFAKNVKISDYKYYDFTRNFCQFIDLPNCNEEQKKAIERREKKLNKFIENIEYSGDADIPGVVSLVFIKEDPEVTYNKVYNKTENPVVSRRKEIIQIPITKRELAKFKVLPEEIGWEKEKKAKLQESERVYFSVPDKENKRNDFIRKIKDDANNIEPTNAKISFEQMKTIYENNVEKDEKEL